MSVKIIIRADGNSRIGFGHIIRTQALAHELVKAGAEVIFLTRSPENIRAYQSIGIPDHSGLEGEDTFIEQVVREQSVNLLIIDNYAYNQQRLDRVSRLGLKTVYIDDMNLYEFKLDNVINGNLYAPHLNYRGSARFLLGSEYLLLRDNFQNIKEHQIGKTVENVLISMGAADMHNLTPLILNMLKGFEKFSDLHWQVVVGPAFRNREEIARLAANHSNISLHYNPDVKTLMDFADIAISAAGSTTYELAACGVPSILVVAADNQRMLAEEAQLRGIAINTGQYTELDNNKLYAALGSLLDDSGLRQKMANAGQKIVDGRGAERVVKTLLSG